jgi:hypothetical protein
VRCPKGKWREENGAWGTFEKKNGALGTANEKSMAHWGQLPKKKKMALWGQRGEWQDWQCGSEKRPSEEVPPKK